MVQIGRLFWKKAYTSDGFLLGEVEDAEVDVNNTWLLTNFYIGLTDEATTAMGFKRPWLGRVVVCLPISVIESFKDAAILRKTKEEILGLRECKE